MIFLIASIFLTTYLIVAFKILQRLNLGVFQAIVFNYVTCALLGSYLNKSFAFSSQNTSANWFGWAVLMGLIFIVLYNLVGITTQKISAAVSAVSYKISLIIPAIFGVYLYGEQLSGWQCMGIAIALGSVVLTFIPADKNVAQSPLPKTLMIVLPVVLFVGSGIQDTLIKYIEFSFLNDTNKDAFLASAFATSAVVGVVALGIRLLRRQQIFNWRNIIAGVCIGVPNYFSIWCLVKYLQQSNLPSSAVLPINNMGIVFCSALIAKFIFDEKFSVLNTLGIVLAVTSILLIAFG